jgi:tRNA U34 2-thiouridine synthase MnmA/TrmU
MPFHTKAQWMLEHDFDFIITGEVMGQRPMSQRKETIEYNTLDTKYILNYNILDVFNFIYCY